MNPTRKTRRPFLRHPGVPLSPAHRPVLAWSSANQNFYRLFRTWLFQTGYSASALNLYGLAARLVLSALAKPYWQIDPVADLNTVRDYIRKHYDSQSTRETYLRGVAKFEDYLRLRCHKPKPEKPIHWAYYLDTLPEWMKDDLKTYIAHRQRSWPLEKRYRLTHDTLSRLTRPLRWLAVRMLLTSGADLTPQAWFTYLDVRLKAEIKPNTINIEMHAVQSWLRFQEEQGKAICQRMLLVDELDEGDKIPRDVPLEQVRALLGAIETMAQATHRGVQRCGLMDKAWFLLMVHSGLRSGEIRRLKMTEVEWELRRVKIEQSKGLKDRLVPLSAATIEALKAYLLVRGPVADLPPHLFIYRHLPLSTCYFYSRLETYGKVLGIKVIPHRLRHTCATLLLNAGAPILMVQAILGHKFVDTTLGYARLYDGTVAADYYQAMWQIERCLALPEDEARPPLGIAPVGSW